MGLDTVELLMEVERFFEISIPDARAERIYTIGDFADCVVDVRKITDNSSPLREAMFQKVEQIFMRYELITERMNGEQFVFSILVPENEQLWEKLDEELGLELPRPFVSNPETFINKMFGVYKPAYDKSKVTVMDFIDAVNAHNYEKLIDRRNITNTYEVCIALRGLIADRAGVDCYEATPDKSITDDLGMD